MTTGQAVTTGGFTRRGIGLAVVKRCQYRQPLVGAMAGFAHLAGDGVIAGFAGGHRAMTTGTNILGLSVVDRL